MICVTDLTLSQDFQQCPVCLSTICLLPQHIAMLRLWRDLSDKMSTTLAVKVNAVTKFLSETVNRLSVPPLAHETQ